MSCLCPISIPDKVLSRFGLKNQSLVVPCGHCTECARDKRNDWFVRLWSVYNRCAQQGIKVWFLTVTINQKLWPGYTLDSPGVGDRMSRFMRSWCERFRYLNGGVMPVRFLCSEFGSLGRDYVDSHGVLRVTTGALHFHGLIFEATQVDGHYVPLDMDMSSVCAGLELTHGYVDFSPIRGPECIRYTVKYATKDFSIENYKLRARVFCSPGIGDPSFYFGNSPATHFVLINGFHYRTPRYFIDKQWVFLYGRSALFNPFGHNIFVEQRAKRRYDEYWHNYDIWLDTLRADPCLFERLCYREFSCKKRPADFQTVLNLLDLKFTGPSHPLFRYYEKRLYEIDSCTLLESDHSFNFVQPFKNLYLNYEGYKIVFPLSLNFTS